MRTYDQTPEPSVLNAQCLRFASESLDNKRYKVTYIKHSRTTGNSYLVVAAGYIHKDGSIITINTNKKGGITRYKIKKAEAMIEIGTMSSEEAMQEATERQEFAAKLGSVAKSLEW